MKKFYFRFEAVEKVRKRKEEEALRVFSVKQLRYREELEKKAALLNRLELALAEREALGAKTPTVALLEVQHTFILGLKQKIIQADHAITKARKKMEKAAKEYREARRQTRTMEILREKEFEAYRERLARLEQAELDDLYVMRSRFAEEGI